MINEINLYPEMNAKIVGLLRLHEHDEIEMYAAKLIESLQEEVKQLAGKIKASEGGEIH